MRDHFIPDGVVITEGDRIVAFGEMKKTPIPADCEIIDAEGLYVGPGFVDIHTHSDGYVFFQDDPVRASMRHLHHGTTTLLTALYFSMDTAGYVKAIADLKEEIISFKDGAAASESIEAYVRETSK
jgi:N-acetylglucosamine-6-phosphate deacetylase